MTQEAATTPWSQHQSRFEFAPPRHFLLPAILLLLSEKPGYGYNLVKDLHEFRFGPVERAAVYRALAQLEHDGLVSSWDEPAKAGQARKVYGITEGGARILRAWMGVIKQERDCLDNVLHRYQATGTADAALAQVEGAWPAALGHAWSPVSSTCASGRRRVLSEVAAVPTSLQMPSKEEPSRPSEPGDASLQSSGTPLVARLGRQSPNPLPTAASTVPPPSPTPSMAPPAPAPAPAALVSSAPPPAVARAPVPAMPSPRPASSALAGASAGPVAQPPTVPQRVAPHHAAAHLAATHAGTVPAAMDPAAPATPPRASTIGDSGDRVDDLAVQQAGGPAAADPATPQAGRRRFRVVPDRSVVLIEARSTVGPIRFGAMGLTGLIELDMDGVAIASDSQPAATITVPVDKLKSGNGLYDAELLRRIEARRFPKAILTLDDCAPVGPDRYRLSGHIQFHGVTRRVQGTVVVKLLSERRLVVTGDQALDVRDYQLPSPTVLMLRIYPDVRINLHLEAELKD